MKGQTNTIVNLEVGSAAAAQELEFRIRNETDTGFVTTSPYVDIAPKEPTTAKTSLTITGKNFTGSTIKEIPIWLVDKDSPNVALKKLNVMVLPPRTLSVGVYTLEDSNSSQTKFATSPVVTPPSPTQTINVLNDVFKQAGIQFTLHSYGAKTYPYDTRAIDIPPVAYNPAGPLRTPDGILDHIERIALHNSDVFNSLFPAPAGRRIFYVKNSGMTYSAPWSAYMIRGDASGLVFAGDADGWAAPAGAHEIGHNLGLSTAMDDGTGRHDLPPYPPGVDGDNPNGQSPQYPGSPHHLKPAYALMASGEPFSVTFADSVLPWLHGRWMRHEDWELANTNAAP